MYTQVQCTSATLTFTFKKVDVHRGKILQCDASCTTIRRKLCGDT